MDPFCGYDYRWVIAGLLKRRYIGFDINEEVIKRENEQLKYLSEKGLLDEALIEIRLGDGTKLESVEDETVDLVFTCPPYWDIEVYPCEHPRELSHSKTYEEFLSLIREFLVNSYRVLKDGKYCVVVVADFRKKGRFYPLHLHTIELAESVGFKLHDIVILVNRSPFSWSQIPKVAGKKYTSKTHEYIIVLRK